MKKHKSLPLSILAGWCLAALACSPRPQNVRIAFYNAENVFDTLRAEGKNDAEFTPEGDKAWNTEKYRTKIRHTARVAADLQADILAMAEVENPAVLTDLCAEIRTQDGPQYRFIHLESGDERGIDPALLYRPESFSPQGEPHLLRARDNNRGILHVKGLLSATGDTLHILVNHWTSRYMGQKATEDARIAAADRLARAADSIHAADPAARIAAMGDLNDTPDEKSVQHLLSATSNLHAHNRIDTRTYYYRKEWLSFDQIFTNFVPLADTVQVWNAPYLLQQDGTPWRTYSGPVYRGGYSDHLPVYIDWTAR